MHKLSIHLILFLLPDHLNVNIPHVYRLWFGMQNCFIFLGFYLFYSAATDDFLKIVFDTSNIKE